VAYLPQSRPVAWPIAVHEAIALGRFAYGGQTGRLSPIDQAAVDEAVAACDLKHLLDRDITTLSGGEAARVHVARALAAKAPALIADEPTAALDPLHQWTIMQVLAQQAAKGSGILTVVHDVTLAVQFCTRVVVIKDGECLASGPPAEVLTPDLLAKAYGIDARWTCDADGSALVVHGPAVQGL
jgi:iron complex transport system ATP-binding protein